MVILMEYTTHSPEETEALGAEYAKSLHPGDVVAFSGDLGAGKTAFTRGVLRGLGYEGRVTSPTFAIANEYDTPAGTLRISTCTASSTAKRSTRSALTNTLTAAGSC